MEIETHNTAKIMGKKVTIRPHFTVFLINNKTDPKTHTGITSNIFGSVNLSPEKFSPNPPSARNQANGRIIIPVIKRWTTRYILKNILIP